MAQRDFQWSSGLFACDAESCCYGFWCCPCLAFTVSGHFGENSCLPLCDMLSPAILTAFGIPLFVPPAALALRAGIRNRYDIRGSLCKDIAISYFCVWCSWCQMYREMKRRIMTPTVVNMQSNTIINVQPAAMIPPGC